MKQSPLSGLGAVAQEAAVDDDSAAAPLPGPSPDGSDAEDDGGDRWEVHKFGGTSVRSLGRVIALLRRPETAGRRVAAVVSAVGGVTNALNAMLEAAAGGADHAPLLEAVLETHRALAAEHVASEEARRAFAEELAAAARRLGSVLESAALLGCFSEDVAAFVAVHGELWSSRLLQLALGGGAERLDAREALFLAPRPDADRGAPALAGNGKAHTILAINAPELDWPRSEAAVAAWERAHPDARLVVVTGFACSGAGGRTATLGRNGSDYSASLLGALLGASSVTIWTDVAGVFTADPRVVPDARRLDRLSYEEATELARLGGEVIHPHTMRPAMRARIPIRIKSTFAPADAGTVVSRRRASDPLGVVKCFSNVNDLTLINVELLPAAAAPAVAGAGGHAGSAGHGVQHLLEAVRDARVPIVQMAHAAFENVFRVCVHSDHAALAERAVRNALPAGAVRVEVVPGCAMVAAVGDGIVGGGEHGGISGVRFFRALHSVRSGVYVVTQSSSQRSISVVLPAGAVHALVRALHSSFLSTRRVVAVGVIGPSRLALELVRRVCQLRCAGGSGSVDIRLRGVMHYGREAGADGRHLARVAGGGSDMCAAGAVSCALSRLPGETELSQLRASSSSDLAAQMDDAELDRAIQEVDTLGEPAWRRLMSRVEDGGGGGDQSTSPAQNMTLAEFGRAVADGHADHAVLVDCTKAEDIGAAYVRLMGDGVDVVSTNQRALVGGDDGLLERLLRWQVDHRTRCLVDSAVGTGVAVGRQLREMVEQGDEVVRIDGVLSVVFAHVFRVFSPRGGGGTARAPLPTFSEACRMAYSAGLTEAHSCDDYSGGYAARKLLLLVRLAGGKLTRDDVEAESLMPPSARGRCGEHGAGTHVDNAEVIDGLADMDADMARRREKAHADGCVLRYVASWDRAAGSATVRVVAVPEDHPFAALSHMAQVVHVHTRRYGATPLMLAFPASDTPNSTTSVLGELHRLGSMASGAY